MPAVCCQETWGKIPADEPVFILRAQDILSPLLVEMWCNAAEQNGVNAEKVARAREHWRAITRFQVEHRDRCKLPD